MTDLQYLIIGLVLLAGVLNFGKILGLARGQGAAPPPPLVHPPTVTVSHAPAEPTRPLGVADLAALLNQSIEAEATTRAVTRSVESMIQARSSQVQLTWAGSQVATSTAPTPAPAPSPAAPPVPNP